MLMRRYGEPARGAVRSFRCGGPWGPEGGGPRAARWFGPMVLARCVARCGNPRAVALWRGPRAVAHGRWARWCNPMRARWLQPDGRWTDGGPRSSYRGPPGAPARAPLAPQAAIRRMRRPKRSRAACPLRWPPAPGSPLLSPFAPGGGAAPGCGAARRAALRPDFPLCGTCWFRCEGSGRWRCPSHLSPMGPHDARRAALAAVDDSDPPRRSGRTQDSPARTARRTSAPVRERRLPLPGHAQRNSAPAAMSSISIAHRVFVRYAGEDLASVRSSASARLLRTILSPRPSHPPTALAIGRPEPVLLSAHRHHRRDSRRAFPLQAKRTLGARGTSTSPPTLRLGLHSRLASLRLVYLATSHSNARSQGQTSAPSGTILVLLLHQLFRLTCPEPRSQSAAKLGHRYFSSSALVLSRSSIDGLPLLDLLTLRDPHLTRARTSLSRRRPRPLAARVTALASLFRQGQRRALAEPGLLLASNATRRGPSRQACPDD